MKISNYKYQSSFEERKKEHNIIKKKFPDRVAIIIEPSNNIPKEYELKKNKFLVPNDLCMAQFMYVIRKNIKIPPEKAIFIYFNNSMAPTSATMQDIYVQNRDSDGFLYCTYAMETVFG